MGENEQHQPLKNEIVRILAKAGCADAHSLVGQVSVLITPENLLPILEEMEKGEVIQKVKKDPTDTRKYEGVNQAWRI